MTNPSILQLIEEAKTVGICSHLRPDGDNIGSLLALKKLFENLSKKVYAIGFDPVPSNLQFLPGSDQIQAYEELDLDLLWIVDCANYDRMGPVDSIFGQAKASIAVDHHESNEYFANYNLVNPKKSSTCELVFDLLEAYDLDIDEDMATCLYAGILTDTNRFMYDSVDEKTLAAASKLLQYGARSRQVIEEIFQSQSLAAKRLEIDLLAASKFYFQDRVVLAAIQQSDLKKYDLEMDDLSPLVNVYRDTDQVEISVLFKEEGEGFKVSLRSKKIPVRPIAEYFGGGGHDLAAGCFIEGSLDQVEEQLLAVIKDVL